MNKKILKNILFICLIILLIMASLFFILKIQNTTKDKTNKKTEENKITEAEKITEEKNKLKNIDSDNDGISDYDEIYIYKTNPNITDSDNDGLTDKEEINLGLKPTSNDSDGDGLLDNTPIYKNNKIIAPKDPNPLTYNGQKGMWLKHIKTEQENDAPTYLTSFFEYDPNKRLLTKIEEINWGKIRKSKNIIGDITNLPLIREIGSKFLTFRLDNGGIVLHSQSQKDIYTQVMKQAKSNLDSSTYKKFENTIKALRIEESLETWQKQFGYNKLFDEVFKIATFGNMRNKQIYFKDNKNQEHVIWLWCGDYMTLGSGAEIGIYKKNNSEALDNYNIEHWDAVNFELPMTLHLYDYYTSNKIDNILNWKPNYNQWWITGFNPNFNKPNANIEVVIGSIDFSTKKQMYQSIKELNQNDINLKDYLIFDDDNYTLWINWYKK